MNDFFKNGLLQKALTTGLEFALTAGEKIQTIVSEAIEKGKSYQENRSKKAEQETETEQEAEKAEATSDADNTEKTETENKSSLWDEYEQRLRRLIETATSKFNFTRNDDHSRLENRIAALEEKMAKIAQQLTEQHEDSNKQ